MAELASHLRLALARLNRRIRQQAAITGEELTASTQAALASVERLGPITLGELAAVEQVQPPSMTRIVVRLDECGFVTRVVDPSDRRVARVAITDAGRDLLARSRTRREAYLAPARGRAQRVGAGAARARASAARTSPGRRAMKALRGTFESLHIRNFRLFFVGQVISQCGTWMQTIALGWLVAQLSHNNGVAIGLALALQFIPTLLFGVWGGVLADRFDKRTVLLFTQSAMATVAVLLAVVDLSERGAAVDGLHDRLRATAWRWRSTTRRASRSCPSWSGRQKFPMPSG